MFCFTVKVLIFLGLVCYASAGNLGGGGGGGGGGGYNYPQPQSFAPQPQAPSQVYIPQTQAAPLPQLFAHQQSFAPQPQSYAPPPPQGETKLNVFFKLTKKEENLKILILYPTNINAWAIML